MQQRIIGFDIARAYAIFGMYIVNFNFGFGSFQDNSSAGKFLNLFTGNSTAIFIILAGMGVTLMTYKPILTAAEKKRLKLIVLKRSWFLFALGLLLYNWWPGDILHFYGGYMHIAAFLLFVPNRYLIAGVITAILIFHTLLFIIPIETSWDFTNYKYADFWTVQGFLRNTLYNGWNSIFPWTAYFYLGMWLGRLNWKDYKLRKNIFLAGLFFFILFEGIRKYALTISIDQRVLDYIMYDYFPPYLPFMIITASFALMVITTCIAIGQKFQGNGIVKALGSTGQMTLSHYIIHLTIGMLVLGKLTNKTYTGLLEDEIPTSPVIILVYSIAFFILSIIFSVVWKRLFNKGPVELIMRKISG